jgi:hypothetical protein
MTDRFKLLGTYYTPRFAYGRRARCQARGTVTVIGLTDALIPWPICSAPTCTRSSVTPGLLRASRSPAPRAAVAARRSILRRN